MKKYLLLIFMLATTPILFTSCDDDDDNVGKEQICNLDSSYFDEIESWIVKKKYDEIKATGHMGRVTDRVDDQNGGFEVQADLFIQGFPVYTVYRFSFDGVLLNATIKGRTEYMGDKYSESVRFAMFRRYVDDAYERFGEPTHVEYYSDSYVNNVGSLSFSDLWTDVYKGTTSEGLAFYFRGDHARYIYTWVANYQQSESQQDEFPEHYMMIDILP